MISFSSATRTLRLALLLVIGLNLLMIGIRISLYHPLLKLPGGPRFAIEPIILLIVHALLVVWATNGDGPGQQTILLNGTVLGLISGGLEIVHLSVENFAGLSARAESISTGLFMLGLFLLWGTAGYWTARSTAAVGPALLAGSWSAVVAMLLTAAVGLALLNTSLRRLELKNIGSPDLIRSGWTDLRAFTIADLFEAVAKVLFVGPILGAIFGGLGGLIARMFSLISGRTAV